MQLFKCLSLVLLFTVLFYVTTSESIQAQDSVPCNRTGIVNMIGVAVTNGEIDELGTAYEESDCDELVIQSVQQFIDIYNSLPDDTDTDCETGTVSCIADFDFSTGLEESFEFGDGISAYSEFCNFAGEIGLDIQFDDTNSYYGFGIQFTRLPDGSANILANTHLIFYVLGQSESANNQFRIGLKDITGTEIKVESNDWVAISTSNWRRVQIPLMIYSNLGIDLTKIENISLDFNPTDHGSSHICVDGLTFN